MYSLHWQISSVITIHRGDLFDGILSVLNRACHSSSDPATVSKSAACLTRLFFNANDACAEHILPSLIEHYHRLNRDSTSAFANIRTLPYTFDRKYLQALDILMDGIERSAQKSPYRIRSATDEASLCDSSKRLLAGIFDQRALGSDRACSPADTDDCVHVFRAILKKIFTNASLAVIQTSAETNEHIDFKIDEKYFDLTMVLFEHLHRMARRCSTDDERQSMIEYFSTVLFAGADGKEVSVKVKQNLQLLIEHLDQIESSESI